MVGFFKSLEKQKKGKFLRLWTVDNIQTKQWTETNVSSDDVGDLNLENIIPSGASFLASTLLFLFHK